MKYMVTLRYLASANSECDAIKMVAALNQGRQNPDVCSIGVTVEIVRESYDSGAD